jgi:hypothetical protein
LSAAAAQRQFDLALFRVTEIAEPESGLESHRRGLSTDSWDNPVHRTSSCGLLPRACHSEQLSGDDKGRFEVTSTSTPPDNDLRNGLMPRSAVRR